MYFLKEKSVKHLIIFTNTLNTLLLFIYFYISYNYSAITVKFNWIMFAKPYKF